MFFEVHPRFFFLNIYHELLINIFIQHKLKDFFVNIIVVLARCFKVRTSICCFETK